jgi:glycosidase
MTPLAPFDHGYVDTSLMKSRRTLISLLSLLLMMPSLTSASAYQSNSVLPDWAKQATIYEVNIRQYSAAGDFKSVTQSLPRLQKLGVGILWLMPIQPISKLNRKGTLGSPYSVADYKGINPEFGNSDDLKALIDGAHKLGMKVIIDWVANHSGWDNPWIANKSWYHQDADGNIIAPNRDWTDVAWLNYDNAEMRAAMIDAMKYWVNQFGIDGFRADVASGVPVDFWEEAGRQLQKIKPLFMLAEEQGTAGMLDQAFISNYNWRLLNLMNQIANGEIDVQSFVSFYRLKLPSYPTGSLPLNFITNHDENSWNGSEYKRMGAAVPAMAALYFTLPGIPLIYSGQEVGNTRELEFFEKDLIPNLGVSNETTTFYSKLVALKKKNKALWNSSGLSVSELLQNNSKVVTYFRSTEKNQVVTIVNASATTQKVKIDTSDVKGNFYTFTSGKKVKLGTSLSLTLKPWQFEIYSTSGN